MKSVNRQAHLTEAARNRYFLQQAREMKSRRSIQNKMSQTFAGNYQEDICLSSIDVTSFGVISAIVQLLRADYSLQTLNSIPFHTDSCKRYLGKNYVNIFWIYWKPGPGNPSVSQEFPTQPTRSLVDKSPSQLSLMLLIGNDTIL